MSAPGSAPSISIVIPCYNEEVVLPLLRERLVGVLDSLSPRWEILFIDDGSTDRTAEIIEAMNRDEPRFKLIRLSRNFGHQAAVAAGLHYASGDAVAVMDADLQDPPEVLAEYLRHWRGGYDVVFAIRRGRKENVLLRASYAVFYRLLKATADTDIPLDAGDFCVLDRRVVEVLRSMPERNMFVRGMRAWVGFRQLGVSYERGGRAAGRTKYSFGKLFRLALDGILSFSTAPLRVATFVGAATVGLNVAALMFVMVWRIFGFEFMGQKARDIPGWAGAVSVTLFVGGVQLLVLGVVGEYIARIYDEVKRRPRWIVRSTRGVSREPGEQIRGGR